MENYDYGRFDMKDILTDVKSMEWMQKKLPQAVYDGDSSAYHMAKILARKYNQMFGLYPVSMLKEKPKTDLTPRLVRH